MVASCSDRHRRAMRTGPRRRKVARVRATAAGRGGMQHLLHPGGKATRWALVGAAHQVGACPARCAPPRRMPEGGRGVSNGIADEVGRAAWRRGVEGALVATRAGAAGIDHGCRVSASNPVEPAPARRSHGRMDSTAGRPGRGHRARRPRVTTRHLGSRTSPRGAPRPRTRLTLSAPP